MDDNQIDDNVLIQEKREDKKEAAGVTATGGPAATQPNS